MDQLQDRNHSALYRINCATMIPSWVLESELVDEKTASEYPNTAFADPDKREYPIFDPSTTWLSMAMFNLKGCQNDAVKGRLEKAASGWNLTEQDIRAANFPIEKSASAQGSLVNCYDNNGRLLWSTLIGNADDLMKLASDIQNNPWKYAQQHRRSISSQLLGISKDLNFELPDKTASALHRFAGLHAVSRDSVVEELKMRTSSVRQVSPDLATRLEKLASELQKTDELVPFEMMEKTAGIVDIIDRATHLHRFLPPIESSVRSLPANSLKSFQKMAVSIGDKFASLDTIRQHLGSIQTYLSGIGKSASEEKEVIDSLSTLNSDQTEFILGILSSHA